MSISITENMVQQFSSNFKILGQQFESRLVPFTQHEGGIVGTGKSVERLGRSEAYDLISRHGDTVYVDTPHSRRWLDLADKAWADLVDEMDKIKMLADPTSPYLRTGVAALNRSKDDIIIAAARGNARTNTALIPLPAGQKIAVGAAGLTIAKLTTAKEMLDAAEVDQEQAITGQSGGMEAQRVIVVSARQISNLLGTTEIRSADFNTVKALAQGQVDTFLGFKFIRSERLPRVGSDRFCLAWSQGCVAYGTGMDVSTTIDRLPNKNNSVQVYARMSIGAVRVEDEGVVEIACLE